MDWDVIWEVVDRFGIIVGLIVALPVFYSAYAIQQFKKQNRVRLENIRKTPGNRPVVLIVDVMAQDGITIRPQVENWIKQQEGSEVFAENCYFEVKSEGQLEQKDLGAIADKIRNILGAITADGADKIHLFLRGPIPVALITGEILANGCTTVIYHNQRNEGYQNWGVLHQ